MKTQDNILKRLSDFRSRPELDPLKFRQEMLLKFTSFGTLEHLNAKMYFGSEDWEHLNLTECELTRHLHILLKSTFNHALARRDVSIERGMQMIEVVLWLLDDDDAIEFMNKEDYGVSFGLPIIQYLSKRYGDRDEAETDRG